MIPAREALAAMLDTVKLADVKIAIGEGGQDVAGRPCPDSAGAVFSQDEDFRYLLWRIWNPDLPFWSFGMLNPSTADHMKLDPTVKRCCLRALNGGAGGLIVWNLFAWRATDPAAMKRVADPIGPFNDDATRLAVAAASLNIAAWGSHGTHREREFRVRAMLGQDQVPLHALGFTATRLPRHPLYLSFELQPRPWRYWE